MRSMLSWSSLRVHYMIFHIITMANFFCWTWNSRSNIILALRAGLPICGYVEDKVERPILSLKLFMFSRHLNFNSDENSVCFIGTFWTVTKRKWKLERAQVELIEFESLVRAN